MAGPKKVEEALEFRAPGLGLRILGLELVGTQSKRRWNMRWRLGLYGAA